MSPTGRVGRARTLLAVCSVLSGVSLALGCTGVPEGVEPVRGFEIDRYLGTWYEIARLDHRFERGLTDVTATYAPRADGGITVRNRGYDPEAGTWEDATGRAYFRGDPSVASLKVSFFGPFFGGYHVIALDREGYADALVTGPSRDYLWILAREPELPAARREALVGLARDAGYAVDELIWVEHTRTDPALPDRSGAGAGRPSDRPGATCATPRAPGSACPPSPTPS